MCSVEREDEHFVLTLDTGEIARFRKVIVATGIAAYAHVAPELRTLPAHRMTHSSACNELDQFSGKRMVVVGGGASAADCAALLSLAGADVQLVTRRAQLGSMHHHVSAGSPPSCGIRERSRSIPPPKSSKRTRPATGWFWNSRRRAVRFASKPTTSWRRPAIT